MWCKTPLAPTQLSLPHEKGHSSPSPLFLAHFALSRSPISATAELLLRQWADRQTDREQTHCQQTCLALHIPARDDVVTCCRVAGRLRGARHGGPRPCVAEKYCPRCRAYREKPSTMLCGYHRLESTDKCWPWRWLHSAKQGKLHYHVTVHTVFHFAVFQQSRTNSH